MALTPLSRFFSGHHFFALASLMLILYLQPGYARDSNPQEVQVLVGTKIPPRTSKKSGDLPGFQSIGSSLLERDDKTGWGVGLDEGFIGTTPVFVLFRIYPDLTQEVLDIQSLPKHVLEWKLKDGKVVYGDGYNFSEDCRQSNSATGKSDQPWFFGLVKPEKGKKDCAHFSRQIFKAWRVSRRSGKVEEISTHKMQCHYLTMDSCY